jgi:pyruvate formate lyase activating enzyme
MLIGGIHTLTLLDFPEQVACILFTVGCNMRCGYCHNAEFVLPDEIRKRQHDFIPEKKIFSFLDTRKGLLDGVVISGGEPTLHADLPVFIRQIKEKGFLIKLDTNGTNPEMIQNLFSENLIDYIAMDVKTSEQNYDAITGVKNNFQNIKKSRDLILQSGVKHEFRTTIIKGYHDEDVIEKIAQFCKGASRYTLQNFRSVKVLDANFRKKVGFSDIELKNFKKSAEQYISNVVVLS